MSFLSNGIMISIRELSKPISFGHVASNEDGRERSLRLIELDARVDRQNKLRFL